MADHGQAGVWPRRWPVPALHGQRPAGLLGLQLGVTEGELDAGKLGAGQALDDLEGFEHEAIALVEPPDVTGGRDRAEG